MTKNDYQKSKYHDEIEDWLKEDPKRNKNSSKEQRKDSHKNKTKDRWNDDKPEKPERYK